MAIGGMRSQAPSETVRCQNVHRAPSWLTVGRARLTLLLAILAALIVFVLTTRVGAFGTSAGGGDVPAARSTKCPSRAGAPAVASAGRAAWRGLREDLRGVMFGRGGRLYEQGIVAADYAWSDGEPGKRMSLPLGAHGPDAYELRWWAGDGNDVGADVFAFASAGQARDFFERASSADCRPMSAAFNASSPPGARDLVWRNPDGWQQEDVYLLRGPRVYRVAVVLAGAGARMRSADRTTGFSLVNGLACALPEAACHPHDDKALAQQALAEQLVYLRREFPTGEPENGAETSTSCGTATGASQGETGSAISASLYYRRQSGLQLGVRVYSDDTAARKALARDGSQAALSCRAGILASDLRARGYRTGTPRRTVTASRIGDGAFVVETHVPVTSDGRSYGWVFDIVAVRQGRIVEALSTVAAVSTARIDGRLAAHLARFASREQRQELRTGVP